MNARRLVLAAPLEASLGARVQDEAREDVGASTLRSSRRLQAPATPSSVELLLSVDTTNPAVTQVFGSSRTAASLGSTISLAFADPVLMTTSFGPLASTWATLTGASQSAVLAGVSLVAVRLPDTNSLNAATPSAPTASISLGAGIGAAAVLAATAATAVWCWLRRSAQLANPTAPPQGSAFLEATNPIYSPSKLSTPPLDAPRASAAPEPTVFPTPHAPPQRHHYEADNDPEVS